MTGDYDIIVDVADQPGLISTLVQLTKSTETTEMQTIACTCLLNISRMSGSKITNMVDSGILDNLLNNLTSKNEEILALSIDCLGSHFCLYYSFIITIYYTIV